MASVVIYTREFCGYCTRAKSLLDAKGVDYIEYGASRNARALQKRTAKLLRELRALGYQIIPPVEKQVSV